MRENPESVPVPSTPDSLKRTSGKSRLLTNMRSGEVGLKQDSTFAKIISRRAISIPNRSLYASCPGSSPQHVQDLCCHSRLLEYGMG
jgi:hypothetical protein